MDTPENYQYIQTTEDLIEQCESLLKKLPSHLFHLADGAEETTESVDHTVDSNAKMTIWAIEAKLAQLNEARANEAIDQLSYERLTRELHNAKETFTGVTLGEHRELFRQRILGTLQSSASKQSEVAKKAA